MRKLKLSLLNKWELDKNYSIVLSSAMLHDGRAVVLTSEKEAFNRYCLLEVSPLGVKEIDAWNCDHVWEEEPLLYKDGKASYFLPNWESASPVRGWDVTYTEYEWERSSQDIPHYENNLEEFKGILARIEDLAIKIECENFAKVFHSARNHLLDLDATKVLEEPQIPPQNQKIFRAASAADVFGAMGSWNDEPGWLAQDKGLGQQYDDLSDQLLRNIRLAILYAINEW